MEYLHIIIDVVVALVLLLTIILGVKRGLVKTSVGLIYVVLAIVITVAATAPLTNVIIKGTNWSQGLQTKLEESISTKLPNAYVNVFYDDIEGQDEKGLVYEDASGERHNFDDILKDDALINALGLTQYIKPSAEELLKEQADAQGIAYDSVENQITFIDAVTTPLTSLIFTVAVGASLFILSLIVLRLLLLLLSALIRRLYIVHFLDKLLGGIMGLLLGVVFILIILMVVQLMSGFTFMEPVNEILAKTTLTKFFMDNNIIYKFVVDKINLQQLIDGIAQKSNS